ncbi:MAG: hypothetical protein Q7R62_01240 [bacterium]|nr:hypothetical protein [bacterium]
MNSFRIFVPFRPFVWIFFVLSYFFVFSYGNAATLFFYPQNIDLATGEEALVDLRMDTGTDLINAVELEGSLSGVAATIRSMDNSGSALSIFVEQPELRGKSAFRLVGGSPAGLRGEFVLARLVVRGEISGLSALSFNPESSRVLLADGIASVAPLNVMNAQIQVIQKSADYVPITSRSHPDQNQWYATDVASFHIDLVPGTSYSYLISQDPLAFPDDVADQPSGNLEWQGDTRLDGLTNGVYYVTVKKIGSSVVSRYRLMNDLTEPKWVEVQKNEGIGETEGRPFLTFLAQDQPSGVEYYEMRIDGQEATTVASPQPLPDEYRALRLRAYDRAGNYIEKFIPGPTSDYWPWIWGAILLILIIKASGILKKKKDMMDSFLTK